MQKTIFYVYILCVSCVSVSSVFPVSANSLKKPKKVSITCHQSNPPQRWLPFSQAPVFWSPAWPELLLDPASFMCMIPASRHCVLNTWLSAPEGFEKRDGGGRGGILSASQAPTKYWIHTYKYTVSVLSIKTGEWENSKINCAQTRPADLTHTLDLILLLRLLQTRALGKEAHLHQQTFLCKKRSFTCIYSVFPAFLCLLFFLCLQIRWRNPKKCLSHVISRILHSVGSLLVRLQCVGILLGRSFC